jgi:hypothetical protein
VDRAILRDENHLLFEQNNESNVQRGTKSTIQGIAKVIVGRKRGHNKVGIVA